MKKPKEVFLLGHMTLRHWLFAFVVGSLILTGCIASGITSFWLLILIGFVYWVIAHDWYNRRFDDD